MATLTSCASRLLILSLVHAIPRNQKPELRVKSARGLVWLLCSMVSPQTLMLAEPSDNARARGIVCWCATDETSEAMPLTQRSASCLCTQLDTARRNGDLCWANPSGYVRVTIEHKRTSEGAVVPEDVRSISVSDRHGTDVKTDQLETDLREYVMKPVRPVSQSLV